MVFACAALSASAQMGGPGPGPGMSAAMTKLFGDVKAFSAKADVRVLDSAQKEIVSMPMDFTYLDSKMRVELDMTQMKNSNMPPGAADQLKAMGMARVVSIIRPDQKQVYIAYPDNKVVMKMPLPDEQSDAANKDAKLQKTELGKETVDGHPCVKNKVLLPDGKGKNVEATTWNATDLKDFPVQIETKEAENTSRIHFAKVQLEKPDAKQFEPPEGYTQYNSPQELMQGMMSKMAPKGDAPKADEKK